MIFIKKQKHGLNAQNDTDLLGDSYSVILGWLSFFGFVL